MADPTAIKAEDAVKLALYSMQLLQSLPNPGEPKNPITVLRMAIQDPSCCLPPQMTGMFCCKVFDFTKEQIEAMCKAMTCKDVCSPIWDPTLLMGSYIPSSTPPVFGAELLLQTPTSRLNSNRKKMARQVVLQDRINFPVKRK